MPKTKALDASQPIAAGALPAYQNRSREQRDRLLKAGEQAFAANGFWQTHITDIAERAGCSVGSFYRRFEDKEAFFLALQADRAARAEANIGHFFGDPARAQETVGEVIGRLVHYTARNMHEVQGYYRALFELSLRGLDVWPSLRRIEAIEAEHIAALLRARGVAVEPRMEEQVRLGIRVMHGHIIQTMLHGPGPWDADDPRLHAELGLMLIRYLGIET